MNVQLISLNTKYVHTNLALRSLRQHCPMNENSVRLREFTINQREDQILGALVAEKAQVYAFSVYIWNVEATRRIMGNLKKVMPHAWIVAGGPEVSYLTKEEALALGADVIVEGEGEKTFPLVLEALENGSALDSIPGVSYKDRDQWVSPSIPVSAMDLDRLAFPYTQDELRNLKDSILYYESTRGCPFRCAYCMSSVEKGLRSKSLEKVYEELGRFLKEGVGLVKFVDRTFNCDLRRTKEILKFLLRQEGTTCFHFEVAGDLLDEEILELFRQAPPGRFQVECGVQTVHKDSLERIQRKSEIGTLKENMTILRGFGNVHVHMDLIAGLPGENLDRVAASFNEIMECKPHMLQLGFLKILKGSPMEELVEEYGYGVQSHPPYQVLFNRDLPYEDLWTLHLVEHVLEKYYNSGLFPTTLEMVENMEEETAFDFYRKLAFHWSQRDYFDRNLSRDSLYQILLEFLLGQGFPESMVYQTLKLDYLIQCSWPVPPFLGSLPLKKEKVFALLHEDGFVDAYLPQFAGVAPKEIVKKIHMERFSLGKGREQIGLFYPGSEDLSGRNGHLWLEDFPIVLI